MFDGNEGCRIASSVEYSDTVQSRLYFQAGHTLLDHVQMCMCQKSTSTIKNDFFLCLYLCRYLHKPSEFLREMAKFWLSHLKSSQFHIPIPQSNEVYNIVRFGYLNLKI